MSARDELLQPKDPEQERRHALALLTRTVEDFQRAARYRRGALRFATLSGVDVEQLVDVAGVTLDDVRGLTIPSAEERRDDALALVRDLAQRRRRLDEVLEAAVRAAGAEGATDAQIEAAAAS